MEATTQSSIHVSLMSSGPPRILDVLQIAGAREQELHGLLSALGPQDGHALGSMPRSLRRRTTSHNPYRHVLRPNKKLEAVRAAADGLGPTNRRMRRRAGHLTARAVQSCEWRPEDLGGDVLRAAAPDPQVEGPGADCQPATDARPAPKRLETHVWHAKRMPMQRAWGWVLPLRRAGRGRGQRSLVARLRGGAVLAHDASYWAALALGLDKGSRFPCMGRLLGPGCIAACQALLHAPAGGEVGLMLYAPDGFPAAAIAPAILTCVPGTAAAEAPPPSSPGHCALAVLWVHAAAVRGTGAALAQVGVPARPLSLRRLELVGRGCDALLRGLCPSGPRHGAPSPPAPPAADGALAVLAVWDPRLPRDAAELDPSGARGHPEGVAGQGLSWDAHAPPCPDSELAERMKAQRGMGRAESSGFLEGASEDKDPLHPAARHSTACRIGLVRHSGDRNAHRFPGVTLLVPGGWVGPWWQRLVLSGAQPLGQEEWREIHCLQHIPFFPHDFPETEAGRGAATEASSERELHASKRPANKPAPESPALPTPSDWVRVSGNDGQGQDPAGAGASMVVLRGRGAAARAAALGVAPASILCESHLALLGKGRALVPGTEVYRLVGGATGGGPLGRQEATCAAGVARGCVREVTMAGAPQNVALAGYITTACRGARETRAALVAAGFLAQGPTLGLVRAPGARVLRWARCSLASAHV